MLNFREFYAIIMLASSAIGISVSLAIIIVGGMTSALMLLMSSVALFYIGIGTLINRF